MPSPLSPLLARLPGWQGRPTPIQPPHRSRCRPRRRCNPLPTTTPPPPTTTTPPDHDRSSGTDGIHRAAAGGADHDLDSAGRDRSSGTDGIHRSRRCRRRPRRRAVERDSGDDDAVSDRRADDEPTGRGGRHGRVGDGTGGAPSVVATAGNKSVKLTWKAPASNGAPIDKYDVQRYVPGSG